MQRDLGFQDGSNDKAYFTLVPNYVLNHSTANDQALYLQMKRFAGEKAGGGLCYASKKTLMARLGIGKKALASSIKYLIEHGWITADGTRLVSTNGGVQEVEAYIVNDIWKLNVDYYQGGAESAPPAKGGLKGTQGGAERNQRGALSAHKEELIHKTTKEEAAQSAVLTQKPDNSLAVINQKVLERRRRALSFGDPGVEAVIEALKQALRVATLDGTQAKNRQYAAHLIRRMGGGEEGVRNALLIIQMAVADPFHAKNATDLGYIYRNALRIFNAARGSKIIKV